MAKNFSHRRWADKVYNPDIDLDNVRNRVVGILLGLLVTAFVFNYIARRSESACADMSGKRDGNGRAELARRDTDASRDESRSIAQ